jgi:predicted acylesterase/phospholipase RssA/CRP-like cAMP-binding protein
LIGVLDQVEFREIKSYLQEHEYADGDAILVQGEVSGRFHIIVSGETEVMIRREIEVPIARLERGQFIGEMSCLTGEPISATVKALGAVRTVSLSREGLHRLMDVSSSFRKHMLEAMVDRIRNSNQRVLEEHARSHAVSEQLARERESRYGTFVAESSASRSLLQAIRQLAEAGSAKPVWIVGENGTGKSHAAYEIHRRSHSPDKPCLTMEGDRFDEEEWRLKRQAADGGTIIIRRADQLEGAVRARLEHECGTSVRLIWTAERLPDGSGGNLLNIAPLRERIEEIPALVYEFLRREGAHEPREAITPEALRLLSVYPYLKENVTELERIVIQALALSQGKVISGSHLRFGSVRKPGERPKIGLALGSGSVRGAAHVGVIKVLEEENIPIDCIAGTSVGAFIGALYAGGQPVSNFEKVLPTVRWRQLLNPTVPAAGIVDNQPMMSFVERFIGPADFSDLNIPFAAVASDALTGEAYILNKGRVSRAICASTAIPGVMRPVRHDGRLLIDGAVVHPVPVALCRSMGADLVIAVNVGIPAFMRRKPGNFISAILNTIDIMSDKIVQEELQLADLVIHPHLDIHDFTFKSSLAYIEKGAQAMREALPELGTLMRS